MSPREIGQWLANECSDEELVETMIHLWKYSNSSVYEGDLEREDVINFDIEKFTNWVREFMGEIIHSNEIDMSAWWKQGIEVTNIEFVNEDGDDDETQFDTQDEDELKEMWWEFCKENNLIKVSKGIADYNTGEMI